MSSVLVIGIGNRQRGDDGVGPAVVDLLQSKIRDKRVEFTHVPQLTPDLAEKVSKVDFVIFIETVVDAPAGSIGERPVEPGEAPDVMLHQVGAPQLLALAQATYNRCPQARSFSVGAAWMGFGHKLSKDVLLAVPELLKRVRNCIEGYLGVGPSFFKRGFHFRWGK